MLILGALAVLGMTAFVSCGVGALVGAEPQPPTAADAGTKPRPRVTVTVSVTETVTVTATPKAAAAPKPTEDSDKITLPNVVGKNGAIARETLEEAGFKNIEYASGDPDAQVVLMPANWRVTKQEPGAGKKHDPKSLVVLTLVKAS